MINEEYVKQNMPKITVITVVFNGSGFIEETIRSVLEQDYPDVEYIVIDGGSRDGTVDIIRNYASRIDFWSSESDRGIYDAMNKGILKATGEWINFMNAGDHFVTAHTLSDVFNSAQLSGDILFGGVEIRYPEFSRNQSAGIPKKLWQGMQFSHQSAFIKRDYHQSNLYNIHNRIAADLQFFYNAYIAGVSYCKLDGIVASVVTGGLSEKNRIKTIIASRDAICDRRFNLLIRLYYVGRIVSALARSLAKKVLPQSLVKSLILQKK